MQIDQGKLKISKLEVAGGTILFIAVVTVVVLVMAWTTLFKYVQPGEMLVITAKSGKDKPPDQILAKAGEKGILEDVLGEGRHFVWPILYETEKKKVVDIQPGQIGIVVSKVGKPLSPGEILAGEGQKGIRRKVLPPGRHRLNPYGYDILLVDVTRIDPGFVGFSVALAGQEAKGSFAEAGEKGVRKDVLQPGYYYINPKELKVQAVEIGVNQISFLETDDKQIEFPSVDGFLIDIDATVEWELHPRHVAAVMKEFGQRTAIEDKVIRPQSKSISRLQGSTYGAKEFLLGEGREKFQKTFTEELTRICDAKNLTVHSAFIRRIVIPDNLLEPIKEAFVSVEKEKTAKFWEETKKSDAELQRETSLIDQRIREVEADTDALIRQIKAAAEREVAQIDAETGLKVAELQQEIALIEAERTRTLGAAEAQVVQMAGEAEAKGFADKVGAFGGDSAAFARYEFSEGLPKEFTVRVVHAGEGTLWTDLSRTAGVSQLSGMKILEQSQKRK